MTAVDRTAKHRLERLSKMVPTLMSKPCHRGDHGGCSGAFRIATGDRMELHEINDDRGKGVEFIADSIGALCGCLCHKEAANDET